MTSRFDDEESLWRLCELAWARWLSSNGYNVHPLGDAVGNASATLAPMASTPGRSVRAPDILTTKAGVSEYWEVKLRTSATVDPITGVHLHWISREAFYDYRRLARTTQFPFHVVVHERGTATRPGGRWLEATLPELLFAGRLETRHGGDGLPIEAWVWPVNAMREIAGPLLQPSGDLDPVIVDEGQADWLDDETLDRVERGRRRQGAGATVPASSADPRPAEEDHERRAEALYSEEHFRGLTAAAGRLGVVPVPRYSLTWVGDVSEMDDILSLLQYGIRVFLVTSSPIRSSLTEERLAAYRAARLLEYACVPTADGEILWAVDGRVLQGDPRRFDGLMRQADLSGGLNFGQWQVVHGDCESDVLVTAGAGTGKTETMAERMLFLLATSPAKAEGSAEPGELTPAHFAFVTFTREAALQMRTRLSRTLLLRRRLSPFCVLPVTAWLLQIKDARVGTIQSFAKDLLKGTGAVFGFSPNMRVARLTRPFRDLLQANLSSHLARLDSISVNANPQLPPAYSWEDHIEHVWNSLEGNGVSPLVLHDGAAEEAEWGAVSSGHALASEVVGITRSVVQQLAVDFADLCRDDQVVPMGQLVPLARHALMRCAKDQLPVIRHLFVDEFQDTDAEQINLFLELRSLLDARMFAVGDVKQGIYRFRGAAGDAFKQLASEVGRRHLPAFSEFGLTRNFRSGQNLLASLHSRFENWAASGLLDYGVDDALRAAPGPDESSPVGRVLPPAGRRQPDWIPRETSRIVRKWRREHPDESVAVLCRENWQAREVQKRIISDGGSCTVYQGGEFFRVPAVLETRALLGALMSPETPSSLLVLAETRWAAGIMSRTDLAAALTADEAASWRKAVRVPSSWSSRLASLSAANDLPLSDLSALRQRLEILRGLLTRKSVMGLLVDAAAWFAPDATAAADDADGERVRYSRCLNHLITLMSSSFDDSNVSLGRAYDWLALQIATNNDEDEPYELEQLVGRGSTVALTVHKAKGLEYDRVVIPYTTKEFVSARARMNRTETAVIRREGNAPRFIWQWQPSEGVEFRNYIRGDEVDTLNQLEDAKEEARLLYVAVTRARKEVQIFDGTRRRTPGPIPNSWAELARQGA